MSVLGTTLQVKCYRKIILLYFTLDFTKLYNFFVEKILHVISNIQHFSPFFPTGGVLHLGCTHGVVYYHSPLWWQESARDHGDALLSLKFPPTAFISDIAGCVARHVNNRTHQKFFQPHDGRLCAPTAENISAALEKKTSSAAGMGKYPPKHYGDKDK